MKKVMYVTETVAKGICIFSVVALLVMLIVTILDVFLRFFFNAPLVGSIEIARMMLVCMSPAFVYALVLKRHIQVPLIIDMLGRKGQLFFDLIGHLIAAGLCGLMFYQGLNVTSARMAQRHVYSMLRIPTWPFYLLFSVAMGLFAVVVIICLIDNFMDKTRYVREPGSERVIRHE